MTLPDAAIINDTAGSDEDYVVIDDSPGQPARRDPLDYRVVREKLLQLAAEAPPPFQLYWTVPRELDVEWIDD